MSARHRTPNTATHLATTPSRPIRATTRGSARVGVLIAGASLLLVAGITVPVIRTQQDAARDDQARAELARVGNAISRYQADSGIWPANSNLDADSSRTHKSFETLRGFSCLFTNVHREEGWDGPYLDHGIKESGRYVVSSRSSDPDGVLDPWGNRFYVGYSGRQGPLGERGGVYLLSSGSNGQIETDNTDLVQGKGGGDDLVFVARPATSE